MPVALTPVTLEASVVVAKTAATSLVKKFGGSVIQRWTNYRADCFFEGFVERIRSEFSTGIETQEADKCLHEILSDDAKSEVLFDAYRRVCFSKSKDIGPRIIGLLTGQIVCDGRMADKTEESVFEAAEMLSDGDLLGFMKVYQQFRTRAEGVTDSKSECYMLEGSIIAHWREESSNSNSAYSGGMDVSPFSWRTELGRWAGKLNSIGLVESKVEHISGLTYNSLGTTIKTSIIFSPGCAKLNDLLSRSFGPSATGKRI